MQHGLSVSYWTSETQFLSIFRLSESLIRYFDYYFVMLINSLYKFV